MQKLALGLGLTVIASQLVIAAPQFKTPLLAPQPTPCVVSEFSATGSQYWKNVTLKLTNQCGKNVDFQNATVTFTNGIALNTNLWGEFSPLAYPDNELKLTSQKLPSGVYSTTFHLHFPSYEGATSVLPNNQSIKLFYGASSEAHAGAAVVYTEGTPIATGTISLTNATAKPANVSQNYALVHLTLNGQAVTDLQLPWSGSQDVPNLAPGTYAIAADSVKDSAGRSYVGSATPSTVVLAADQIVKSTIAYTLAPQEGKVAINLQALPALLSGYTGKPTAVLTMSGAGSSVSQILNWGATTTVSQLVSGSTYNLTTPNISFNGVTCTAAFTPASLVANATTVPTSNLTYTCTQVAQNTVTLNVKGAPTTLSSYKVTLTPNDGTAAVTQTISLSGGTGTNTVKLPNNIVYQVSSDPVTGYSVSYNPQPLTSTPTAVETITLTQASTPIAINGQLKVCGTQLCNKDGQSIQLRGMSTHGLQWYGWGKCVTAAALDTMAYNFKSNVVRLSLYVQEGGYETDPTGFTNQVNLLINEVTKRGLYVLVDWHILNPGDPNYNLARAKTFFTVVANANKGKTNIIYEVANEPNGVSWSSIKSYAEQIIPVIRAIDPNAVIIVGTRGWSSLGIADGATYQEIVNNPVNASNIMYAFHFYAASHRDYYVDQLNAASSKLPIFATEWGTQTFTGGGDNDFAMSDKFINLMASKKISWTNWNFSDDYLSGAIWNTGTCAKNQWGDSNLKASGVYIKAKISGS